MTATEVVTQITEAAVSAGLVTNENNTTYMKINRNIMNSEQDLITNGQVFEDVQNFRYVGALINSVNVKSDEIKSRVTAGNRCFYSLRQIFRSRTMRKAVKIKIPKTMVKPVAVYGSETWATTEMEMKRLSTYENKILRRIHGPVVEQEIWRIRNNHELRELYVDLNIVADIKKKIFERET